MKYYFFRDKDNNPNLKNGKTFHTAGFVLDVYSKDMKSSPSGKDVAVAYLDPFEVCYEHAWRAFDEVELFEVEKYEYDEAVRNYKKIEKVLNE